MQLSPVDRRYATFPLAGTDADGNPVTLTGVAVAVLPYRALPDALTTWTAPVSYIGGKVKVLLAGFAADPTGALPVSAGGGELWAIDRDNPEVQAVRVGFISIS